MRFKGLGSIDCRICSHRTVFPQDAMVVVYNLSNQKQVLISADDRVRLHHCGLEYVWVCPECRFEPDQEEIARIHAWIQSAGHRPRRTSSLASLHEQLDCPVCGTRFQQEARDAVHT